MRARHHCRGTSSTQAGVAVVIGLHHAAKPDTADECRRPEEVGYAFVQQFLSDMFPALLDLDHFNARRRALVGMIEVFRRDLRDPKRPDDPVRLVDSAPVTLLTYTRGKTVEECGGQ